MKTAPLTLAALALASLSACGKSEPELVGELPDPMAAQVANAAPVVLPPAVKDSRSYRCKDNSLIFVDFLADNVTANLRMEKDGTPTKLVAPAAGEPFAAEGGYEVAGTGGSVTVTVPGKAAQSCSG